MNSKIPDSKYQKSAVDKKDIKLNWLRAAVLGANDGIVSVASILAGVAGASNSTTIILTAGMAGLVAGAFSMAVGEYVSVSTQRDTEKALLQKEHFELENNPEAELKELAAIYKRKGLSEETAQIVAKELTDHDVYAAHFDVELGINPGNLTNPWYAAYASAIAFCFGGVVPIIAIIFSPLPTRIPIMFIAVLIALIVTGTFGAHMGGANKKRAIVRVVFGGTIAMLATFTIGKLFKISGL